MITEEPNILIVNNNLYSKYENIKHIFVYKLINSLLQAIEKKTLLIIS